MAEEKVKDLLVKVEDQTPELTEYIELLSNADPEVYVITRDADDDYPDQWGNKY